MRAIAFILGLAAAVAIAVDWRPAGVTPTAVWLLDRDSVGLATVGRRTVVIATVRRSVGDQHTEHLAAIEPTYCGAARGDISLDGTRQLYLAGEATVAATLAAAICAAHQDKTSPPR